MKRYLALFLSLVMILCALPLAIAEDVENPYEDDGIVIYRDADGNVIDLGGMEITVCDWWSSDWHDDEPTTAAGEATYDYRTWLEETYNFKIVQRNALIVSLAVSVLQIAACTLVGYGFARFEFPFKKFWFAAVIITVIIPPQTISSSLYLHFNFFDIFGIFKATTGSSLNLRGSPIPYALMSATCMGLKNGLYIYMIRQFFTGIPKSLEEAAYVDGCSIFKTFWRVILPDAVPILVSCFLFSFVWQWTDTFYSKLFLGNIKLLSLEASTVADRLNSYVSIQLGLSGGASMGYQQQMVSTATLMLVAPLLVLYLFAQRSFVESIAASGIKG